MKKSHVIELIIFVILLSILIFLGVKVFKNTFDIGETYHLQFTDINGIVIGSPVRILGVDIGHVTKIKPELNIINVDFVITDDNIKIPKGTTGSIESFGLAGSRSIELLPPTTPVNSYTKEIITSDPIRLGHAFNIMKDFLRATMVSIGGLYEFAKNRTQDNVETLTKNAVNSTKHADDKIVNVTNSIQRAGNTTEQNIKSTTKGMNRLYTEASAIDIWQGIMLGRYMQNITRRSLIRFERGIKTFNPKAQEYAQKTNQECAKLHNLNDSIDNINHACETTAHMNSSLNKINNTISDENINKWHIRMEKIRRFAEKLQKKL